MARMRYVKPEIWTDRKFVQLSAFARLLFIGMWNFSICEQGHLDDDPFELKMRIFPADSIDAGPLLDELVSVGLVDRENGHLTIRNLSKHQKTDTRWSPRCPYCPTQSENNPRSQPHDTSEESTGTPEDSPKLSETLPSSTENTPGGDRRGGDRKGERESRKRATALPADWQPTEDHKAYATESGIDLDFEAEKFRNNCEAKGLTYKNHNAAFSNWIRQPWVKKHTNPQSQLPEWMTRG